MALRIKKMERNSNIFRNSEVFGIEMEMNSENLYCENGSSLQASPLQRVRCRPPFFFSSTNLNFSLLGKK